jgi:hypothetical protein
MKITRLWIAFLPAAYFVASTDAVAQRCPPNAHYTETTRSANVETIHCECDIGFKKNEGTCRRIGGDPQCVKRAGERLNVERQQVCAGAVGLCFESRKILLSAAAVACVAACRQVGSCAVGCGIAGLAAERDIEACVDAFNGCQETALARYKDAVLACKVG